MYKVKKHSLTNFWKDWNKFLEIFRGEISVNFRTHNPNSWYFIRTSKRHTKMKKMQLNDTTQWMDMNLYR